MFALLLSMSLGGATGSTSGGIKALRLSLIVKNIVSDIKRALSPDTSVVQVRYHHLTDLTLDSTTAMRAMVVFLLFVITYLLGGMVGVALGYSPLAALFESVSVTSNAGISAGILVLVCRVFCKGYICSKCGQDVWNFSHFLHF